MCNYKKEMSDKINIGLKCYLTIDEWTSNSNKRYLNVNVHYSDNTFYCIGLIRIKGVATATNLLNLIGAKLESFNILLKENVISITSDGAAVMKKLGKDSEIIHVMCSNHALHLAVMDFLKYEGVPYFPDVSSEEDYIAGSGIESSYSDAYDIQSDAAQTSINNVLYKIRTIVRMFRKSAKNDDILQKYMVIEFGRERKLQLDCCTRWNSIENMLSVFLESLVPIKKTLLDLKKDFNLNAYEISIAKDCLNILIPQKEVVLILSERNNDIVIAEQALNMLCDEYNKQDTFFSKQLCELIKTRYDERRDIRLLSIIYFFMYNETYLNNHSEFKFNTRDEIIKDLDELKKNSFPIYMS